MAVWVEFSADWDFQPHPAEIHAYSKGSRVYVPQSIADRAVAAGRAEIIHKPDDLKATATGPKAIANSSVKEN